MHIKCAKCGGPCWEEDLLDSDRYIDIVCIMCGLRRFYPKKRYLDWKNKRSGKQISTHPGRALPA